MEKISQNLPRLPTIWNKGTYNILNKHQIKLLWVFFNIDIVLESKKKKEKKKFLRLSDPLIHRDMKPCLDHHSKWVPPDLY